MLNRVRQLAGFLGQDIWSLRVDRLPRHQALWLRPARIVMLAIRGYVEDRCQLRASALTFYTLLSIVPVVALAFAIAKGFGFDATLEGMIRRELATYGDLAERVIGFAHALLVNTRGGLIAGAGVLLLFWSVIRLLSNIENSFNDIWGVTHGRSLDRRLADYLAVMLIAPIVLIVSSGANVFLFREVQQVTQDVALLNPLGPALTGLLKLLPYALFAVFFTFLYRFMPNTRVSLGAAVIGGVIAGSAFVLVQWVYIAFQVGVASYNAIYGSFAALPLLLAWIQVSWLVVFFGAEVAFAVDNESRFEFEHECRRASLRFRRLLALRIVQHVGTRFKKGEPPLTDFEIAERTGAPLRLVRATLEDLVDARVLSRTVDDHGRESRYQPAVALPRLTLGAVLGALDRRGIEELPLEDSPGRHDLAAALAALDARVAEAPENRPLVEA